MMGSSNISPNEAKKGTYIMVGDSVKYEPGFGKEYVERGK